jgi:hypothetical protein
MKKSMIWCLVFIGLAAGFACKSSTSPDVDTPPTITSFAANPATISRGETSTLSWNVKDATSVSINQGIGAVAVTTGTKDVTPTDTITYTLTATNADGSKTATCTVTVEEVLPTIDYFTATPASIKRDDASTLSWSVQDADTVTIDHGVGAVAATGTVDVTPQDTTTYTLTATNSDGDSTATCQVEILPAAIIDIATDPATPDWNYDVGTNTTSATFSEVFTETNGVAGHIYSTYTGLYLPNYTRIASVNFGGGDIDANGTLTLGPHTISGTGQATICVILAEGWDDNDYDIYEALYTYINWGGTTATAQFQKVIPGVTDPRIVSAAEELKTRKR